MLIKGTALVWVDDQEMELSEGGIVFLPKNIPHAYRVTSKTADLLMINTPAGIEGMFRHSGAIGRRLDRTASRSRPRRWQKGAREFGQIILGPPRVDIRSGHGVARRGLHRMSAQALPTSWSQRVDQETTALTVLHRTNQFAA